MIKLMSAVVTLLLLLATIANAKGKNDDNVYQVEDGVAEMDDLDDLDELDDLDDLDESDDLEYQEGLRYEERARPSRFPFCERSRRSGWGGKCSIFTQQLVGYRCDYIWNNTYNPDGDRELCYNNEQACCVDCKVAKQTQLCKKRVTRTSHARGYCCPHEMKVGELTSGCNCCKVCKRKPFCRRNGGYCVTKLDPVYSAAKCIHNGWRIKKRACRGWGCWCCLPPIKHDA
ncbi:unnamed protein product [Meganyctiphanes norvegica]|uniref:Uncharacterized protein n=1 Tax=Meganyctiphanes norvegica TaxID=48144 RepID=A0AAV2RZN9_MEGNR